MVGEDPQDWVELYQSALMELDRGQLSQKIEAAHQAIQRRINELTNQKKKNLEETQELSDRQA